MAKYGLECKVKQKNCPSDVDDSKSCTKSGGEIIAASYCSSNQSKVKNKTQGLNQNLSVQSSSFHNGDTECDSRS